MGYYKEDMRQETLSAEIKALEDQIAALGLKEVKSANEIDSPTLRLKFDKLQLKIKDLKKQKKGGFRAGSGRKSKYENIETCVMRVPKFLRGEIEMFIEEKMIQYGKPKHQTSYDLTKEHNREEKELINLRKTMQEISQRKHEE